MGTYRTVLVGTDGSDSSFRAVDRAAEIARDEQAKLVIVCAYYPASKHLIKKAKDEIGADAYQVVGSNPAMQTLDKAAERAIERGVSEKDVEPSAVQGEPAKSLLDELERTGAGLVVVGNRGLNTVTERILGSVPTDVMRQARCDALVVHTTA
jgi:nucleotide-binding universal stress UspA family protein